MSTFLSASHTVREIRTYSYTDSYTDKALLPLLNIYEAEHRFQTREPAGPQTGTHHNCKEEQRTVFCKRPLPHIRLPRPDARDDELSLFTSEISDIQHTMGCIEETL